MVEVDTQPCFVHDGNGWRWCFYFKVIFSKRKCFYKRQVCPRGEKLRKQRKNWALNVESKDILFKSNLVLVIARNNFAVYQLYQLQIKCGH